MVLKLNKYVEWRKILGQEVVDLHFKDIEIIARGFAMLFMHEQYQATMNRFLNKFSKLANRFDYETINYLEQVFIHFINCCSGLKDKAFCNSNGKFSISLFESVFVAVCEESFKQKQFARGKILQESIEVLKKDSEFALANKEGVSSKKNVEARMRRAKEIIVVQ